MEAAMEQKFPPIGSLLRLIGGKKEMEYRGMNREGKAILFDLLSHVTHLVRINEVCWIPIIKIPDPVCP